MAHLLVVDDEKSICEMLDIALRKQGHRVETVTSLEMARRRLLSNIYDIVITDIKLPQGSGLDVLQHVRETQPETLVILVTAYASVDSAVQALNLGAFRYIIKTPNLVDEVRVTVARGVEERSLRQENRALKRELRKSLDSLLGVSPPIKALKELVATVAPTNSTILITGESGTGKELVARAIHAASGRWTAPLSRSTAAPSPRRCSRANCSATSKAPSPAPPPIRRACSSTPTPAPCFWTRSRR